MKTVCLVGCCKEKQRRSCAAQDLYLSPLFRLCRRWAERNADAWAILSAGYGCVLPEEVIEPYDRTIRQCTPVGQRYPLRPDEYALWLHAHVQARFVCRYATTHQFPRIIVLAGKEYWQPLKRYYQRLEVPLDGLGIGQRLKWLKQQLCPELPFEEVA